jgi:hypothetical protein
MYTHVYYDMHHTSSHKCMSCSTCTPHVMIPEEKVKLHVALDTIQQSYFKISTTSHPPRPSPLLPPKRRCELMAL